MYHTATGDNEELSVLYLGGFIDEGYVKLDAIHPLPNSRGGSTYHRGGLVEMEYQLFPRLLDDILECLDDIVGIQDSVLHVSVCQKEIRILGILPYLGLPI